MNSPNINNSINLEEVYDIWYTPFYKTDFGIIVIFMALIIAAIISFLLFKLIKKVFKLSPRAIALKRLNSLLLELNSSDIIDIINISNINNISGQAIYKELTDILKNYVQNITQHITQNNAKLKSGATDVELVKYLKAKNYNNKLVTDLSCLFSHANQVKFANTQALKERLSLDIKNAILFVKNTNIEL